jgi:hypothetical protein
MATIDDQQVLHDAGALCAYLLLRPGKLPGEDDPPVIGEELDRSAVLAGLVPALDLAWPDRTDQPDELVPFLEEAGSRIQAKAEEMAGAEGFVPAALVMTSMSRDLVFEHLKQELTDVLGGIETEDLWEAFDAVEATAAIKQLTRAGLLIKIRSLGSFLVGRANKYEDEIAAEEFFPTGGWKTARDEKLAARIATHSRTVNKGIAHLTLTRPLPEDRDVYRPASYRTFLEEIVLMFEAFTDKVDERLLPSWWKEWFDGFAERSRTIV